LSISAARRYHPVTEESALTKILVVVLLAGTCVAASAQTQPSSGTKTIKGSGCVEKAVETSCHVLLDAKTGETYNLLFSGKVPKAGTAIWFRGTEHNGMTTCMQGKPVNVTQWKKEKDIKCPPPSRPETTH
jgi:hypothetical protein